MNFDFDPSTLTNADLFGDQRRILFIDEPGYRCYLHNLGNGQMAVEEEWPDLQALFDHNAEEANDFNPNGKHGDFVKVASIPQWMLNSWESEAGRDKEWIRRKLNDPDNAKFRTNGWRL